MRRRSFLATAGALLLGGCRSDNPAGPSDADALLGSVSTTHYDFHFAAGDGVDAARQEAFHDWVLPELGVSVTQRLQYFKYRDRAHMQRVTSRLTNGWADPPAFAAHSIWPWDAHEALHIYTELLGRPSDLFNEGIAVALSYDPLGGRFVALWNSTPIHEVTRNLLRGNALPSLRTIAETEAFRRVSDQVSYPVAGSFMSFLLDRRGMPATRSFFQISTRGDPLPAIEANFLTSFGVSLDEAETGWHASL
jgi:hypothetical protein